MPRWMGILLAFSAGGCSGNNHAAASSATVAQALYSSDYSSVLAELKRSFPQEYKIILQQLAVAQNAGLSAREDVLRNFLDRVAALIGSKSREIANAPDDRLAAFAKARALVASELSGDDEVCAAFLQGSTEPGRAADKVIPPDQLKANNDMLVTELAAAHTGSVHPISRPPQQLEDSFKLALVNLRSRSPQSYDLAVNGNLPSATAAERCRFVVAFTAAQASLPVSSAGAVISREFAFRTSAGADSAAKVRKQLLPA